MREGGVRWMLGEFGIWEVWVLLCDYSWDCWSRGSSTVVVVPCGLCWVQWDHSVWQCWTQTIWTLCAHRTFQKEILRKVWCRQSNSFGRIFHLKIEITNLNKWWEIWKSRSLIGTFCLTHTVSVIHRSCCCIYRVYRGYLTYLIEIIPIIRGVVTPSSYNTV